MTDYYETKSQPITRVMVWQAYKKVKQNKGGSGVDGMTWAELDNNLSQHLYKLWNRLSSGSYIPDPVKAVLIPKKDGGVRPLGIPTLLDRIAQQVVKHHLEMQLEPLFHDSSYGYRPNRSAHDAVAQSQRNCFNHDFAIDLDIKGYFDTIDHDLMMQALRHYCKDKWVHLYVERWLKADVLQEMNLRKRTTGTPQGGVISPLLANLYLHFTLDKWFDKNHPDVRFVRYADDVVVHCKSERQAKYILTQIKSRLGEVKLSIKDSKTKIAYCKDYRRKADHEHVTFDFLGFSFKPSKMMMKDNRILLGFLGDISKGNEKKIMEEFRSNKTLKHTGLEIQDIAINLNSKLIGWINYYGLFTKRGLRKCMYQLATRIKKWIRKKYRLGTKEADHKYKMYRKEMPNLFYHWSKGYC